MQAVVFRGKDIGLAIENVVLERPRAGEVAVRITAAGVCHSDLHVIREEWEHPLPVVLGHEGSGVVTEVGDGVEHLAVGDHVVLAWVSPCGECRFCKLGDEARCSLVASVVAPNGVLHDGTSRLSASGEVVHHYLGVSSYAEEVVVPASGAIKVRKDAPLDVIAIVGCAVATGVGAVLNTAKVEPGATVAIFGCGGVGASVVQGARIAGASRIIAIDLQEWKLEFARTLGATDTINASTGDPVALLRKMLPEGVDYAFDVAGSAITTRQAIDILGLGGAAVIVGLPPTGVEVAFQPLVLAESEQRILGSNYGSIRPSVDIPALVDRYMAGDLRLDELITGRRPLSEAQEALEELQSGHVMRTLLLPSVTVSPTR